MTMPIIIYCTHDYNESIKYLGLSFKTLQPKVNVVKRPSVFNRQGEIIHKRYSIPDYAVVSNLGILNTVISFNRLVRRWSKS